MGDAALPKRCSSHLKERRKTRKESCLSHSDFPTKISRIFSENEWIPELRSDDYSMLCLLYCCVTRDLSRYQQTSVVIDATSTSNPSTTSIRSPCPSLQSHIFVILSSKALLRASHISTRNHNRSATTLAVSLMLFLQSARIDGKSQGHSPHATDMELVRTQGGLMAVAVFAHSQTSMVQLIVHSLTRIVCK
jgi:hypothetical protein